MKEETKDKLLRMNNRQFILFISKKLFTGELPQDKYRALISWHKNNKIDTTKLIQDEVFGEVELIDDK